MTASIAEIALVFIILESGPLEILDPAEGLLASLTNILASLENYYKHTYPHTETLLFM